MAIQKATFRSELKRAGASGVLETASNTFLLLIAVRHFDAGPLLKGIIAAGGSLGFLLAPIVVLIVERRRLPVAKAIGILFGGASFCFLFSAFINSENAFAFLSLMALGCTSACVPLFTQLYQDNYDSKTRGHLLSKTILVRISVAILFSEFGGRILSKDFSLYPWILVLFSLSAMYGAFALYSCPSKPLSPDEEVHTNRGLRYITSDPLFRYTLISWMLLGFGNLMMWPLRVEYLANPKYGLTLSAIDVALLTGVLPNIARLAMSSVWGKLFDRMDFYRLRVFLNMTFALGIISFFISTDWVWLVIGAVFYGIANAGGDVAWSLWVTKIAPPERVADYMAVHTFLTGVRGVTAPLLAFQLLNIISLNSLGWICVGLIGVASLMLITTKIEKINI